MTVVEKAPEVQIRSQSNTGLILDPKDITFEDLIGDTVIVRVKVRNAGEQRSSPTRVRLESAPFGAFVPWRRLAVLPVPPLEPGESRELSVVGTRPHPTPLGDFDRVPPMSVLTALSASSDEPAPRPATGFAALLDLMRKQGTSRPANYSTVKQPVLPSDLWDLL